MSIERPPHLESEKADPKWIEGYFLVLAGIGIMLVGNSSNNGPTVFLGAGIVLTGFAAMN